MDKIFTVMEIVVPIFVVLLLGMYAKKKQILTREGNEGLQQFVIKFGLPCILFNSCFTAIMGMDSVLTMGMVSFLVLVGSLWAFRFGKKKYPYHSLPFMFSAQESGMLGIPLFVALFGAEQAYRVGIFDLAQCFVVIPVISIITCDIGDNPSISSIIKKVFQSPLLLVSLLGLFLNLSGLGDMMNNMGIGGVITQTTGFLAEPVSAAILFTVGYNFSLGEGNRSQVFRLAGLHFTVFMVFGLLVQGALCFMPDVEMETRIAVLLYFALPCSFLTPGFGKSQEEYTVTSGVCALLTVVCLAIFCGIAALVA